MKVGEREFVARRQEARDYSRSPRCWGISSDALTMFGLGYTDEVRRADYPADPSDLLACQLTYEMAPKTVQRRMKPALDDFWTHVVGKYPDTARTMAEHLAGLVAYDRHPAPTPVAAGVVPETEPAS